MRYFWNVDPLTHRSALYGDSGIRTTPRLQNRFSSFSLELTQLYSLWMILAKNDAKSFG